MKALIRMRSVEGRGQMDKERIKGFMGWEVIQRDIGYYQVNPHLQIMKLRPRKVM